MNNKKQNDIKKEVFFELNEELQMKIFDRFLLVQILCTFVGSFSNTIIHGVSPVYGSGLYRFPYKTNKY